jgi:tetratricopeptide (TPR) repeat protein
LALTAIFFVAFLGPLWAGRGESRTFTSGVAIGLAAFALHNLADFTAFLPSVLVLACVMRGLVAADRSPPVAPIGHSTAWVLLALVAGLIVTGSGVARDALHEARVAASEGNHGAALAAAQRGRATAPWDPDLAMFAAEARMAQRLPEEALRDCDRAVRLAPERAAARALRARARLAVQDPAGAYADLFEATRLYPLNERYASQRDESAAWLRNASAGAPR